jgi:hypothetical protein
VRDLGVLVREEDAKPFDLVNGPLIRIRVHRIGPADHAPLGLRYETSILLRQREDGAVAGGWEYDAGLFDEQTALCWRAGLLAVLAHGAANPDTPVAELRRIAADAPTVDSMRSRR